MIYNNIYYVYIYIYMYIHTCRYVHIRVRCALHSPWIPRLALAFDCEGPQPVNCQTQLGTAQLQPVQLKH